VSAVRSVRRRVAGFAVGLFLAVSVGTVWRFADLSSVRQEEIVRLKQEVARSEQRAIDAERSASGARATLADEAAVRLTIGYGSGVLSLLKVEQGSPPNPVLWMVFSGNGLPTGEVNFDAWECAPDGAAKYVGSFFTPVADAHGDAHAVTTDLRIDFDARYLVRVRLGTDQLGDGFRSPFFGRRIDVLHGSAASC